MFFEIRFLKFYEVFDRMRVRFMLKNIFLTVQFFQLFVVSTYLLEIWEQRTAMLFPNQTTDQHFY